MARKQRLVPLIVMVPQQLKEDMKKAAEETGKTVSEYVREVLKEM